MNTKPGWALLAAKGRPFLEIAVGLHQGVSPSARSYSWVEFKNIAMQPEQETDVEVISAGDSEESENEAAKR